MLTNTLKVESLVHENELSHFGSYKLANVVVLKHVCRLTSKNLERSHIFNEFCSSLLSTSC